MDPAAAANELILAPTGESAGGPELIRATITVVGIVQGVGMRPFVVRLAERLQLGGSVRNAGAHLSIEATGTRRQLDGLLSGLRNDAPPAARIVRLSTVERPAGLTVSGSGEHDAPSADHLAAKVFRIADSQAAEGLVLISPDLAICPECVRELLDPADRRLNHALISCIHCGPRYTILEDLPYDRPRTTLRTFPLCPACRNEYERREDRRYHAQTISCPDCGPQPTLYGRDGSRIAGGTAALDRAGDLLAAGGIVAVKGLGGYHLACRSDDGASVARLRRIKKREAKPFAVLFPDLAGLSRCADLNPAEIRELRGPATAINPAVSGSSRLLGAFLPATAIQVLLARRLGPLIMTSANLSGDVICIDDDEMLAFAAAAGLDGVLAHDRRIGVNLDDSVLRLADGQPLLIRRARGYVPLPVDLASAPNLPRLAAAGGDLKAPAALTRDGLCYPGAPVGDLAEAAVNPAWRRQIDHLCRLLDFQPDWLVGDQHPDYLSTRLLRERFPATPWLAVQHHRAHIAAVLAEHPGQEAAIGVAMDGTGFGDDGTVWGGEWLVCRGAAMDRVACLRPIPFAGGDRARQRAWQCLVSHLAAAGPAAADLSANIPCLASRPEAVKLVAAACRRQVGTVLSSSTGSLFDAVSALLGFGEINQYEGQCAQALEQAAAEAAALELPALPLPELCRISSDDPAAGTASDRPSGCLIHLDPAPLFPALAAALAAGADPRRLALDFHLALAGGISRICRIISQETGIRTVALGGGCFQNVLLLNQTAALLRQNGLTVLTNRQVPPGDGGLALGQTWLALRLIAAGKAGGPTCGANPQRGN